MKKEETQQIIGILADANEFNLAIALTKDVIKSEQYKVLTRSPLSEIPDPITREDTPEGYAKKKHNEKNRYHNMNSLKKKKKVEDTRQRRETEKQRIEEKKKGISSLLGNYI